MKNKWLYEKSFPIIVFLCPLMVLYGGFLVWLPPELRNERPSGKQLIMGGIVALIGMFILVLMFSFVWSLLMRIFYGKEQVREWLHTPRYDFGRLLNPIENLFRKICDIALL